jgi:hypothetical protein
MFNEQKESVRRTARCHITLEKSSKNYILCFKKPSQAATHAIPPTSLQVAMADFPRGG